MRALYLSVRDSSPALMALLEKRGLIKRLLPSQRLLKSCHPAGAMETLYCSSARHGSHKLICVKKNSSTIRLNFHPGNEEFIIVNTTGIRFRPLYIVIGLDKRAVMARKVRTGVLSARDFVVLRFSLRARECGIFTMLKDAVHCEVAGQGDGPGPVFFVSEPSRLKLHAFRTPGYRLFLKHTVT